MSAENQESTFVPNLAIPKQFDFGGSLAVAATTTPKKDVVVADEELGVVNFSATPTVIKTTDIYLALSARKRR